MTTEKPDMQLEYTSWLDSLSFYNEKMTVMQGVLQDMAIRNASGDYRTLIEKFQRRILMQQGYVRELDREIRSNPNFTAGENEAAGHRNILAEEIRDFEKVFKSLHTEFNTFLNERM